LDTESMKLREIPVPSGSNYKVVDGALITVKWNVNGNGQLIFEISDPNNRYLINVTDDEKGGDPLKVVVSRNFYDASIRYKMFVACEFIGNGNYRFKIWKLGNTSTLLKTFTLPMRLQRVELGERFLLLESASGYSSMKIDFVSIENEESRNFILKNSSYAYAGGLLFLLYANGIVRVWDPDSGTYLSDVRLPLQNEDQSIRFVTKIGVNSKFVVIGWKYLNWQYFNENEPTYLSVYDLQAIKNINSDLNRHLLYTLEVPLDVESVVTNESQIICNAVNSRNNNDLIVINFAKLPFKGKSSLRKNLQANKKIKIQIVRNSRVPTTVTRRGRQVYIPQRYGIG
jgi:hypothetical protein